MSDDVVLSLALVLAAVGAHWILRRLGRRILRSLARRASQAGTASASAVLMLERPIELALLLPKLAVWVAVAFVISERFPVLKSSRVMLGQIVVMSLMSPLFTLNGKPYSGIDLVELPVALIAVWFLVGAITRFLSMQVLRPTGVERGVQETVTMLTRYALLLLGAVIVLQAWGIDVSSLTFLAGVLGVGIGFGLQHLASNFVSGLVVSIERPIQPGDFIKVGEWTGTVERIGPRSTEIRTLENVAILVPNSRFLETEVVNWSHGDPVSRISLPVGVAYGSDIRRVRAALLEAARSHPQVLAEPRPRVEFHSFGDSALQFELQVWLRDPRGQSHLKSDLNYRIEENLRRHHVEVPFPQHDLHLRSPQIEQLLEAWSRRTFSDEELHTAANGAAELVGDQPALSDSVEDDYGPRAWTDADLTRIVAGLRGPAGIAILDRRHLLSVYPKCFVGRDAVDWLTRSERVSRDEAVVLGQQLIDGGIMHHVLDEHAFKDGNFFYRFRVDE